MDTDKEFASEKGYIKDSSVVEDDSVSSQIGVSEFVKTKIVGNVQKDKDEPEPILKSQIPEKRTSFDRLIIKNLINIQIENGPYDVLSLREYQQKLTENLSTDFSSDQIKKWLTIIGLKWTEESKELEENTENQSSIEKFTLKCSAKRKENGKEEEEDVKLECTEEEITPKNEEEDLSSTLEDNEMTNEEIKPSTKNSKRSIPNIEMEVETQNINVQLEMEGNNEIHIKTELPDIEDEVQADLVNIEEFNQTINTVTNINTENCLDERNPPTVYLDQDVSEGEKTEALPTTTQSMHPLTEKNITDIGTNSVIREKTPYPENLPSVSYFYRKMVKTRYRCTMGSLIEWLPLLKINVRPHYYSNFKKKEDKLSFPIIELLRQFEKEFYENKKPLPKYPIITKKSTEDKDKDKCTEENSRKYVQDKKLIPTLDYFYHCLKKTNNVCCKLWLKKWLQFLNIKFESTICDLGKKCDKTEEQPSPSVIKLLIELEETFHKPNNTVPGALVRLLEDLDDKYKKTNEIPSLDFIYDYVFTSKAFARHIPCLKTRLVDWLIVLKINFRNKTQLNVFDKKLDEPSDLFSDADALPSFEYFFEKIKERDYVCSKNTLMKWLEVLNINYELKDRNLDKNWNPDPPQSYVITNLLINLEDDFYKSKETYLTLPRFLIDLETQFKKESIKIPTLNDYQKKVIESNLFKSSQACCKHNLKYLLIKLNINFTLQTSFNVSPTLSYFHEELQNRKICDISLSELNAWLNEVGIAFENDLKNLVIEKVDIKPISNELRQLLCNVDHEYRLKDLIAHLKNVEKDFDKNRKCLTFEIIYEIIKTTNLFNTDVDTDYKKLAIKKWVRKLGIKFADKKEEVPSLDYFHEKITAIEKNTYSKDQLAKWLNQIGVKFKENHLVIDNKDGPHAPPNLIPNLWQISKYHCMWDVEHIFKKIEYKFISKGQVPSIDYLEKKLFELKGKHYCTKAMLKNWLTFLGITFGGPIKAAYRRSQREAIEKDIDSVLKKKSKINTTHHEETQTDVIEIDDDDDDWEYDDDVAQEQTEVTEMEDDDAKEMPKKKKYKSSLLKTESPKIITEPSSSLILHSYENTSAPDHVNGDDEAVEFPQQIELIEMEDVILHSCEVNSDDERVESPQRTENIVLETPSTSENTEPPKIITEQSSSVISSTPDDDDDDDERVVFPQQTDVIEMAEVNLYCCENPSAIDNVDDDDSDERVEIPQQTEVIEILDDDPEDMTKKTKSPEMIKDPSSSIILPDYLMDLMTDIELHYFRMKKIPTLEHFYMVMVRNYGNIYSKDVLRRCLTKAGIMFNVSPTLSYFREKLQNRKICDFSLSELNAWLNEVGIVFENDLKNLVIKKVEIKPISNELRQLLSNVDREYRLKDLIAHLKNVEKDFDKDRICLPFEIIYEIIKMTNLFNTDIDTDHKKLAIKKWVRKLGIKFGDIKEVNDSVLKKKSTINTRHYEETQTDVIEIDDDDDYESMDLNIERVEFPQQTEIIEMEEDDAEGMPKIITEPTPDYVNGDDEIIEFPQQTELIEMEDVILHSYENTSAPDHVNGDDEIVEFPQQIELTEMEDVILHSYELNGDNERDQFPQRTEDIVVETPSTSQDPNSTPSTSEKTEPPKMITESSSSVISSTPDRVNDDEDDDDERVVFPQQTEVIEMAEVNLYCCENPSAIGNVDGDGRVEIPQQTEVIEIVDDDPEDMPKKTKCKSPNTSTSKKRNSLKKSKSSKKTKSPKMIKDQSSSIILPDYLMDLMTDIENNYFRMKQIPTLEHFYMVMIRNFGHIYSKDVLRRCLTKAGIMFTSNS